MMRNISRLRRCVTLASASAVVHTAVLALGAQPVSPVGSSVTSATPRGPALPVATNPQSEPAPASAGPLRERYEVPAGREQGRLELRRDGALLEATVCRSECTWQSATRWTLPEPFSGSAGEFEVVTLGEQRRAGHFSVRHGERRYELVIAAAHGSPVTTFGVVEAFAGESGLAEGEAPDRRGRVVERLAQADGAHQIVVGDVREDVTLCGRQALLVPKLLHPQTLSLRRVKFQRLPKAERDIAVRLKPAPIGEQAAVPALAAMVASSARGTPAALTDNDPNTTWTEGRSGDGSGEFVVLRAPSGVGLTGVVLTAPSHRDDGYRLPKTLWLASDDAVFHVELPADDGNLDQWFVPFPEPITTGCLAIALDTAQDLPEAQRPSEAADQGSAVHVGLAEVMVTTDVDDARLNAALEALDSGGDEADRAQRLLIAVGAFDRVKKRFRGYSQSGRMRALNVMDASSCRMAAPVYVRALYSSDDAERQHGERRLLSCKAAAIPVLERTLPKVGAERARSLVSVLLRLDPARAIDAMAPLLTVGPRDRRRVLREAFERAARDEGSQARLRQLLSDPELQPIQGLAVMRALGEQLLRYRQVAASRLQAWLDATDFETRYRLLAPAAMLAPFNDALAAYLQTALRDETDPLLRTEAARRAPAHPALVPLLVAAVSDPHVRVREAAVNNLADHAVQQARTALLTRLEEDPWPLVREAAVRALVALPAHPQTARQLAQTARRDESAAVRRPALHALGKLGAVSESSAVREAFEEDEDMHVRATAAATLGMLCDRGMIDALTVQAVQLVDPGASEAGRVVGRASLSALGRLAPADLERRVSPFFAKGVPRVAQSAATAALSHPHPCGSTAGRDERSAVQPGSMARRHGEREETR